MQIVCLHSNKSSTIPAVSLESFPCKTKENVNKGIHETKFLFVGWLLKAIFHHHFAREEERALFENLSRPCKHIFQADFPSACKATVVKDGLVTKLADRLDSTF